jgi:hypothetical protein
MVYPYVFTGSNAVLPRDRHGVLLEHKMHIYPGISAALRYG